jgi:hypothetical protein
MLQRYQTRAKKLVTNTYVVEDKGNDAAEEILQTFFIEQYKLKTL